MSSIKERACANALHLLNLLENINDEEFVDTICMAISSNDAVTIEDLMDNEYDENDE